MAIATSDAAKKDVLGFLVRVDVNYDAILTSAYNLADATSYTNKGDVLTAVQDILDAIEAARTAVANLA